MKLTTLTALLLFATGAFAQTPQPPAKNLATVPQYSGLYIFFCTTPVREYEFVASVKKALPIENMNDYFTKYAAYVKTIYPNADGIIFRDVAFFGKDKFDVIKFKE